MGGKKPPYRKKPREEEPARKDKGRGFAKEEGRQGKGPARDEEP